MSKEKKPILNMEEIIEQERNGRTAVSIRAGQRMQGFGDAMANQSYDKSDESALAKSGYNLQKSVYEKIAGDYTDLSELPEHERIMFMRDVTGISAGQMTEAIRKNGGIIDPELILKTTGELSQRDQSTNLEYIASQLSDKQALELIKKTDKAGVLDAKLLEGNQDVIRQLARGALSSGKANYNKGTFDPVDYAGLVNFYKKELNQDFSAYLKKE